MEFPVASSGLHSIALPGVISDLFSQDEVSFGEPLGFDPAEVSYWRLYSKSYPGVSWFHVLY